MSYDNHLTAHDYELDCGMLDGGGNGHVELCAWPDCIGERWDGSPNGYCRACEIESCEEAVYWLQDHGIPATEEIAALAKAREGVQHER